MASVSDNPFAVFREQCETLLRNAARKAFPDLAMSTVRLDLPANPEFGELTSSDCFEMAKQQGMPPLEIAKRIEKESQAEKTSFPLIRSVQAAGQGYINFHADFDELSALTLRSVTKYDLEYGFVKAKEPEVTIVEHTSVNPVHPIHIGQARNSVLGDSLARILKARGHKISRHYYIDDVGRQSAVIAYGYNLLKNPRPEGKPDHFIGTIYAITSCLLEIHRLNQAVKKGRVEVDTQESMKLQRDLDEWVAIAADLKEKFSDLFAALLEAIGRAENPELEINLLVQEYEASKEKTKRLIRRVSNMCLEGFKQTLARAAIFFDSWDWESSLVWSSDVARFLDALKRTPYVFKDGGVLEFDAEKVAQTFGLKEILGMRENQEIPSLTLARADGTTLYTTRDITYSLWKFGQAKKVINVVGMEQKLAQLQLKLALNALGYAEEAKRLVHFAYNLVNFPGYKMSSRRGRYVTFDDVMDEAVARAREEVEKRSMDLAEEEKRKISEMVGVGAVKYALVETDPVKAVIFTWERVLDFERNSGPYIQYSYARACSILRKASRETGEVDFSLLGKPLEHDLILMVSRFPEVFLDAAENLKPSSLADYANSLADKFNTFYAALPVIKAETQELSNARLLLVNAIRITLRNALSLIGIEAPERM